MSVLLSHPSDSSAGSTAIDTVESGPTTSRTIASIANSRRVRNSSTPETGTATRRRSNVFETNSPQTRCPGGLIHEYEAVAA